MGVERVLVTAGEWDCCGDEFTVNGEVAFVVTEPDEALSGGVTLLHAPHDDVPTRAVSGRVIAIDEVVSTFDETTSLTARPAPHVRRVEGGFLVSRTPFPAGGMAMGAFAPDIAGAPRAGSCGSTPPQPCDTVEPTETGGSYACSSGVESVQDRAGDARERARRG